MNHKDGLAPNILILSDMMDAGGMERQILELVKGLKQQGNFRVVLGVLDQGGSREAQAKGLADIYLALPRKSRFDISPAYTLIRKMKGLDVRLIHTYGWMSGAAGLVAARLYRLPIINGGFREAPVRLLISRKNQPLVRASFESDCFKHSCRPGIVWAWQPAAGRAAGKTQDKSDL